MACRLEEIPEPRDFVEYQFLDQSLIVLRTDDMGVVAFENTCRHRGVKLVEGSGICSGRFRCPFHGWSYGLDGKKLESMRAEKWYACRLPVNWKLGIEAFVEMYHVVQTHPQLVIPTRFGIREGTPFDP